MSIIPDNCQKIHYCVLISPRGQGVDELDGVCMRVRVCAGVLRVQTAIHATRGGYGRDQTAVDGLLQLYAHTESYLWQWWIWKLFYFHREFLIVWRVALLVFQGVQRVVPLYFIQLSGSVPARRVLLARLE